MLDDCVPTQIPRSLVGSESTHTQRLSTGISAFDFKNAGDHTPISLERYNIVSERDLDDTVRKLEDRIEMATKQLQSEADEISTTPPSSVN